MTVPRAARSGLHGSLGVLGVFCVLWSTGAFGVLGTSAATAAPGHRSRERSSRIARACHRRAKHPRHCRADGKHRKHKRGSSKPSAVKDPSTGSSGAASAPWTAAPAPVIPGSTPGSGGTSTGSGGGAPVVETPAAPSGPAHVQVTAEDTTAFRFVLSHATVPAGPVVIEFVNSGQDEHNLNSEEPGSGSGSEPLLGNTAPKAHPSLSLNLHHGSYTFFCSLSDHRKKGMEATLKVE
jgi:plastocyanin